MLMEVERKNGVIPFNLKLGICEKCFGAILTLPDFPFIQLRWWLEELEMGLRGTKGSNVRSTNRSSRDAS